jgi:hypothetical protein
MAGRCLPYGERKLTCNDGRQFNILPSGGTVPYTGTSCGHLLEKPCATGCLPGMVTLVSMPSSWILPDNGDKGFCVPVGTTYGGTLIGTPGWDSASGHRSCDVNAAGVCVERSLACPPGQVLFASDQECHTPGSPPALTCPAGQLLDTVTGQCYSPAPAFCPPGQAKDTITGQCVLPPATATCPTGQYIDASGRCVSSNVCPAGQVRDVTTGVCFTPTVTCPAGQQQDAASGQCAATCPASTFFDGTTGRCVTRQGDPICAEGMFVDPSTGACYSPGGTSNANLWWWAGGAGVLAAAVGVVLLVRK